MRRGRSASRATLSGPAHKAIDKFAILPILACVFALIVFPVLSDFTYTGGQDALEGNPAPRIFWPAMAAISVALAVQNRSRLTFPPHIICLFMYLALAGASVLWAFSPERSFIRYLQQLMVVASIVLPAMLASRNVDIMRGVFLCFALALIVNMFFILNGSSDIEMDNFKLVNIGYRGYFATKNPLGECAAAAFLLSFHETLQRGWRRALGAIILFMAVLVVFLSHSKTAFALALVCPILAWLTLLLRKVTRLSPAIIISVIPLCYALFSSLSHSSIMDRVSYILYGDSTLTGRTVIWDFAKSEIARSPLLGWGYQSFWLVPGSPAYTEAPGWVSRMPNAHNGYYDRMLETGYVGLALLLVFIFATLHAVGRVADRDPARARLLLSLALFFILYNFFESIWMRGFEVLWVVFLIVAAEIARYWGPFPLRRAYGSRSQKRGNRGPSPQETAVPPFETVVRDGEGAGG